MEIKLYTTGCPKCKILENKFEENDISYEKVDGLIEVQTKAKELGISSVPFCIIDDQLYNFGETIKWITSQDM